MKLEDVLKGLQDKKVPVEAIVIDYSSLKFFLPGKRDRNGSYYHDGDDIVVNRDEFIEFKFDDEGRRKIISIDCLSTSQ